MDSLTIYQVISISLSIFSFLIVLFSLPFAWGKLQQWKVGINDWIVNAKQQFQRIEGRLEILDEIDDCMEQVKNLNKKLYTQDGTPAYITYGVLKDNMERITDNFSNYKAVLNERFKNVEVSIEHVSFIKDDLKSVHTLLGDILKKMEVRKDLN